MADDAGEGLLNPVAHPFPKAPLLMSQQALGSPAPFVAVLTHCVMVRLEAGDEVFQVFEPASTAASRVNSETCGFGPSVGVASGIRT